MDTLSEAESETRSKTAFGKLDSPRRPRDNFSSYRDASTEVVLCKNGYSPMEINGARALKQGFRSGSGEARDERARYNTQEMDVIITRNNESERDGKRCYAKASGKLIAMSQVVFRCR